MSRQLALTTIAPVGILRPEKIVDRVRPAPRIPACPQFRALAADGRAQQRKTARAQILRLVDPADAKPLQRLDGVGGVILHAPENDNAVARRFDLVAIDLEPVAETEAGDLAFDQALGRLRQRPLRLADADRRCAALGLAGFDQQFSEEVRLAGAAAAKDAPCSAPTRAAAQRSWLSVFSGWTMMRSILWISSRAPSSPFSIACVALPQPRSRMALAAATRAGGVALVLRMTATSTLSADLVWLRASERISVNDLGIGRFCRLGAGIFARRGIGMIHREIVGPRRRPEGDGGKIGWPAMALRTADELNDFCAHENPSHTAIATRPASASEIKYAVMMASLPRSMRCAHDRLARSFQVRSLSPKGAIRMSDRAAEFN